MVRNGSLLAHQRQLVLYFDWREENYNWLISYTNLNFAMIWVRRRCQDTEIYVYEIGVQLYYCAKLLSKLLPLVCKNTQTNQSGITKQ